MRVQEISLTGNFRDTNPVGSGVHEFRIDRGPGCRAHCFQRGNGIVSLLIGRDKSSEQKDIDKAKKLNAECQE